MRFLFQPLSIFLASVLATAPIQAQAAADIQLRVVDSDGAAVTAGSSGTKGFTVQVTDGTGLAVQDAAVVLRLPETGSTGVFSDGTRAAVAYTDSSGLAHLPAIQWNSAPGVAGVKITASKGTSHAGIMVQETLSAASSPVAVQPALPPPPAISTPPAPIEHVPAPQPGVVSKPEGLPSVTPAVSVTSPSVSVVNGPTHENIHSGGKTKWIVLAVVAAGAGAGFAFASKGKSSSSSSTASPGVSIGNPTVSFGQP